jgi:N6-adenosine-specific RNA methylase IME4
MSKENSSFVFEPTGVKIQGDPTFEEWLQQAQQYSRAAQGVNWWLGDLLAYGDNAYGEKYEQSVPDLGLAYQTLANMVWVARSVTADRRKGELSWQHHVSIAKLEPAQQERYLKKAIKEKLSAADLKKVVAQATKRKAANESAEDVNVREGKYRILYADPNWRDLGLEALESLKLPADSNSVLFLWSPADNLRDAVVLMERWGFAYQTCAVWDRCKSSTEFWFRGQHDVLLVGVRGNMKSPLPELMAPSVIRAKPGKEGAKPDELYRIVEDMFPVKGKKIVRVDLFGTEEREGWVVGAFGSEEEEPEAAAA